MINTIRKGENWNFQGPVGFPIDEVKSSGVRQSKFYKCQLALMGGKGLNGDIFVDVVVNPLPPKGFPIDE